MPSYQALESCNNIHDVTSDNFKEGFTTSPYGLLLLHIPTFIFLSPSYWANDKQFEILVISPLFLRIYLVHDPAILSAGWMTNVAYK